MKFHLPILFTVLVLASCAGTDPDSDDKPSQKELQQAFFEDHFNDDNIPTQEFVFTAGSDTTFVGEQGCKLRVYANSFQKDGEPIEGEVTIHFKEATEPIDFVMGNLTTVSDLGNLQSGGMIFFEAYHEGELADLNLDMPIGVSVPAAEVDLDMRTWHGQREDGVMEWMQDDRLLNGDIVDLKDQWQRVWFWHHGLDGDDFDDFYDEHKDTLRDWWFNDETEPGDSKDFYGIEFEIVDKKFYSDSIEFAADRGAQFLYEILDVGEVNEFKEDPNTTYLFTLNDMGWANIDRLYEDPRTEKVELFVDVENHGDFDFVYTTLLLKNESMYLPGYQKGDDTYGFTHYDKEKPRLPVGAEAIITATAYKDGKPFFDTDIIEITKEQTVSLKLNESSSDEQMKKDIQAVIEKI